jgi:peptidoglycan-associated lipoprotein
MKIHSKFGWLVVAAVLASGVVGCKKSPQKVTRIPGQTPGAIPDSTSKPIEPSTTNPIKIDETGTGVKTGPGTGMTESGIGTTSKDFSTWAQNRDMFAAQMVHFDFDKAIVKTSETPKVEEVARRLKEMPGKAVRVEGHCDERGTEEYNRALGERRALAIREKLVSLGIAGDMVDTISFGKDKPLDPGHDTAAWSKNRRGEFILLEPPGASTSK